MSLTDLQSWLIEQRIEEELDQLTRYTVRGEIGNLLPETGEIAPLIDWQRLILAASVLAQSRKLKVIWNFWWEKQGRSLSPRCQ